MCVPTSLCPDRFGLPNPLPAVYTPQPMRLMPMSVLTAFVRPSKPDTQPSAQRLDHLIDHVNRHLRNRPGLPRFIAAIIRELAG